MRFDILTLFPELIESHLDFSILKRATEDGVFEVRTINPRDFTEDKHKKVDDTPYGGGAGMVLMPQPIFDCIRSIKTKDSLVIMLTPSTTTLSCFGKTATTLPFLPLSLPAITTTVSSFLTRIMSPIAPPYYSTSGARETIFMNS